MNHIISLLPVLLIGFSAGYVNAVVAMYFVNVHLSKKYTGKRHWR